MGLIIDVKVNDPQGGRRWVKVETVRLNSKTVVVRLPDGNYTKRNIRRDTNMGDGK